VRSWGDRQSARPGSPVSLADIGIAGATLIACLVLPPGGRGAERVAGVDAADVAARGWESGALVVVACLLLVWRRQRPVGVWLAVLAITALDTVVTQLPSRCLAALLVAVYTLAVRSDRRTALLAAVATAAALIVPTVLVSGEWIGTDAIYAFAASSGLAAAIGDSVRNQRASVSAALARAEAAEASRELEARRRVAEERLRIARELHDVVAHHVSVINVQAGVAAHLLESDPAAARLALAHVRGAGHEVIDEMRMMVGLLRTDGSSDIVEPPTPGVHDLDELVARTRAAGLQVQLDDRTGEAELPTTTSLTAYRVVQEALTNAAKYGLGTAAVLLKEEAGMLLIEVSNPVAASAPWVVRRAEPLTCPRLPECGGLAGEGAGVEQVLAHDGCGGGAEGAGDVDQLGGPDDWPGGGVDRCHLRVTGSGVPEACADSGGRRRSTEAPHLTRQRNGGSSTIAGSGPR
jgi:signal transduction histidine kinase